MAPATLPHRSTLTPRVLSRFPRVQSAPADTFGPCVVSVHGTAHAACFREHVHRNGFPSGVRKGTAADMGTGRRCHVCREGV